MRATEESSAVDINRGKLPDRSRSPSPPNGALIVPIALAGKGTGSNFLSQVPSKIVWFNDSHMHPTDYRQNGHGLASYLQHMDQLGIQYTTLMPIPTSLKGFNSQPKLVDSVSVCGCAPSYYLPQSMLAKTAISREDVKQVCKLQRLNADTEVDDQTAHSYASLRPDQKKRFDPMITGLDIGADDCSNKLLKKLERNRNVFTGVGEITLHKEVIDELMPDGWAHLKKNINPLIQLLHTCGEIGMPVVLHCDIDHYEPKPGKDPKYLKGLNSLFSDDHVRKTIIVWAHAGGLGRFVSAREDHVDKLREMLMACPNLHVDISWTVVADRLVTDPDTFNAWKTLLDEFPDRFLFGSDTLAPRNKDVWNATFEKYEKLRSALSPDTVKLVFTENYKRVFVAAREKVRAYESMHLQGELDKLQADFEHRAGMLSTNEDTTVSTSSTSTTSSATVQTWNT